MSIPTFASGKLDYVDITHSTSQRIKAKTAEKIKNSWTERNYNANSAKPNLSMHTASEIIAISSPIDNYSYFRIKFCILGKLIQIYK